MATILTIWGRDAFGRREPLVEVLCLGIGKMSVYRHAGITSREQLMLEAPKPQAVL